MSNPPSPEDRPPDPASPQQTPLPLDYAPSVRPAGNVPFIGQMGIGCGGTILALIAAFTVVGVANSGPALPPWGIVLVLALGPGLILAALTALTVIAWRRWHWRGFLLGVLISLGLLLLAGGLCFAMLASMSFH